MALNAQSPKNGPRIVLGLDYGTTYTGLAWIQTTGQNNPGLSNIIVFKNWPSKNALKVPSEYSYSKTSSAKRCKQWGFSISDDSQVMRWTKLELEPRTTTRELDVLQELVRGLNLIKNLRLDDNAAATNDIPRHLAKDAEDVVMDYLSEVAIEWYSYMRSQGRHTLDTVPLDIVVTHPASWSYQAMNKTFRAVTGAFRHAMFPTLRDISFTSEPEACALYTIQDMLKKNLATLIKGECFILCDAGGGTVDVAAYRTDNIEPLILTKVGKISGVKSGATFIDQEFLEWLRPKLEDKSLIPKDFLTGGHFVITPLVRVLLTRFERVKHAFTGVETGDFSLPRDAIIAEDQEGGLESGVISLSPEEIKKMFEKSVSGAIRIISRQVTQVETKVPGKPACRVTNVFLAGGFAENTYLFNQVKEYTDSTSHIHLQRADDCWSGVVKGAVLRGMSIGMRAAPNVRACPRSYGICTSQIYADWMHDPNQAVNDRFHAEQIVHGQFIWLVRKGDVILSDGPIQSNFSLESRFASKHLNSRAKLRIIFAATAVDDPSCNLSDLPRDQNEVVDLDVDLKLIPKDSIHASNHLKNRSSYYRAEINVNLRISSSVRVKLESGGIELARYETNL